MLSRPLGSAQRNLSASLTYSELDKYSTIPNINFDIYQTTTKPVLTQNELDLLSCQPNNTVLGLVKNGRWNNNNYIDSIKHENDEDEKSIIKSEIEYNKDTSDYKSCFNSFLSDTSTLNNTCMKGVRNALMSESVDINPITFSPVEGNISSI